MPYVFPKTEYIDQQKSALDYQVSDPIYFRNSRSLCIDTYNGQEHTKVLLPHMGGNDVWAWFGTIKDNFSLKMKHQCKQKYSNYYTTATTESFRNRKCATVELNV